MSSLTSERVRSLTAAARRRPAAVAALAEAIGLDAPRGVSDPLQALTTKVERLEQFSKLPADVRRAAWGACFAAALSTIPPLKTHA